MNPRVKELAEQAGGVVLAGSEIEKFAELIVNECCQLMIDLEVKYPANLTVREIKKHFGVES